MTTIGVDFVARKSAPPSAALGGASSRGLNIIIVVFMVIIAPGILPKPWRREPDRGNRIAEKQGRLRDGATPPSALMTETRCPGLTL